jgi:Rrf2 family iron-sulfur cluster assembly transcriptional regulator
MTRYGTRAVFDIAYHSIGLPVPVQEIATRQEIPIRYLEQIFHKLKRAKLLKSKKGPAGGYVLALAPEQITVGDIIRAVKEPLHLVFCVSAENGKDCHRTEQCITRPVWEEAGRLIKDYFDSVTITDLCENARLKDVKKESNHPFDYSI